MLLWAKQFLVTAISAELHFGDGLPAAAKTLRWSRAVLGCQHCWCALPKHSEPSDPKGEKDVEKAQEKAQKAERVDDVEVSCHASAGAKWHLELLAVSAELKEKLQDSQFVATRCDLDGSGDLDARELKQAARVYGISQSGSSENHDGTNPRLMAGATRQQRKLR